MGRSKVCKPARKSPKTPRRPHNAGKPATFRTVGEHISAIGAEPRRATLRGQEVVMSLAERLCRVTVEKAINGSISNLKLLIRLMIDHPQITGSIRERWVLFLAGDDAKL